MKTAIVTGASTGIGRSIAIGLAKYNYHVLLIARSRSGLEDTKKIIEKERGSATLVRADLSSIESINQAITSIKHENECIQLIANVAGIWHGDSQVYAGTDLETFDQKVIVDTYMVGTMAPILLVHGLLPIMKAGCKIINISGTFENGAKGWVPYYVSKRSIEDLTIALAQELEDKKIQVNCISPSDTATTSYTRFFPEYIKDAIDPIVIANKVIELSMIDNKISGKIFVINKDKGLFENFHY